MTLDNNTEDNSNPIASITSPADGARFEINTPISFSQSSSDEDDDISITWNFDDGNTTTLTNCLTGGNCDTTHVYNSSSGTKNVILTVTDARGMTDTDFVSIDVFQTGINLFTRISKPEPNEIIIGTGWVYFNASGSYVTNCSTTCPAGNVCYLLGTLQCRNLNSSSLIFNWTFDDGTERYGTWQGNYSYVVEFNKFFGTAGEHSGELRAEYG